MPRPFLIFILALAAGLVALPALAQRTPSGSYLRSCRDVHRDGDTLKAVCRAANGREQLTELHDVDRCVSDITVNANGVLQCRLGRAPSPGFVPAPGYAPAYPAPGYGAPPPPTYGGRREADYRAYCDRLRYRARDLRDRIAYAPPWERDRLEQRLHDTRREFRSNCGDWRD